jgi:Cupin superfamily protein.
MKRCVENRIESSCIEKKKTKVLEQEHHLEEDESYKNIIEKKQVQSSTSALLGCMIGKQQSNIDDFFKEIYQKVPSLYHVSRKDRETCEVLKMLYFMGWEGVCDMLHKSQSNLEKYTTNAMDLDKEHGGREETATTRSDAACRAYSTIDSNTLPLFFRNQEPLQLDEMKNVYGNSPFAAYLDGCSIVNNHADLLSAPLAALCLDIQKSLPHAYINTYLTPPKAAAVSAHADDRDVFVLQVLGENNGRFTVKFQSLIHLQTNRLVRMDCQSLPMYLKKSPCTISLSDLVIFSIFQEDLFMRQLLPHPNLPFIVLLPWPHMIGHSQR